MLKLLGTTLLAAMIPLAALAAEYPEKPIRIVVPYPPGGASDIFARLVGQKLAEQIKQGVVIDNRPGANGGLASNRKRSAMPR